MRASLAAAYLCLAVFEPALAQESPNEFSPPRIVVDGSAEIEVKPDIAILHLGAIDEKPTPNEAVAENAKSSAAIVEDLKSQGIDPKDIKTESLNLTRLELVERDAKTNLITKRTVTGYSASEIFTIKIRDVVKAGAIVRHIIDHGSNTYRDLSFELTDKELYLDELRGKAVANAKHKAALYAQGANAKLGRVLMIGNVQNYAADGEADLPSRMPLPIQQQTTPIPIEPGLKTLKINIPVTWELIAE